MRHVHEICMHNRVIIYALGQTGHTDIANDRTGSSFEEWRGPMSNIINQSQY